MLKQYTIRVEGYVTIMAEDGLENTNLKDSIKVDLSVWDHMDGYDKVHEVLETEVLQLQINYKV